MSKSAAGIEERDSREAFDGRAVHLRVTSTVILLSNVDQLQGRRGNAVIRSAGIVQEAESLLDPTRPRISETKRLTVPALEVWRRPN